MDTPAIERGEKDRDKGGTRRIGRAALILLVLFVVVSRMADARTVELPTDRAGRHVPR